MTDATVSDSQEQDARIERSIEETRKFVAEQHKLIAEHYKLMAESLKMTRERDLAPWQIILSTIAATAALIGAGAALAKLLG